MLPTIFATESAGNVQASLLDANFTFLESQGVQGITTTGSSNAYIATPADAWATGYSSYVARALTIKPNFGNTGAATINVSGLGAAVIYKNVAGIQTALASGDIVSGVPAILICDGAGFLLANPTPATGFNVAPIANSLSGDVALNNVSNYFDGPAIAQGSTGTWYASGTVTLAAAVGGGGVANKWDVKLWDGATVIASAGYLNPSDSANFTVTLSGCLSAPAGNIRMSAKNETSAAAKMLFNYSGNSKDSTISAFRIQ